MSEPGPTTPPPEPAPAPGPQNNCYLNGTESRFLIQLLTGPHVAIQGPALAYANQLLQKLNNLHMNQPVDQSVQEVVQTELRLLTAIQGAEVTER